MLDTVVSELVGGGEGGKSAGDFKWPPGFRFHPTDEELVLYYLKRKICRRRLRLNVIRELDVYKWDPEDLPGLALLKTGDRQWFFFSVRDHKYPNGGRASRATSQGYWKATGKDRNITCNSRSVGMKKTLVFYRGRAPTGVRTDWVMHEYTMDEEELKRCPNVQGYYALYKIFKKSGPGPKNGEQYGAPFREEDWLDDETAVVGVPEVAVGKRNELLPPVCNQKAVPRVKAPHDNLFDMIKEIVEEPRLEPLNVTEFCPIVQVDGKVATESTMVKSSTSLVAIPEARYNLENSDISELRSFEAPEVNSAVKWTEDDFLEVDDLFTSEPTVTKAEEFSPTVDSLFDGINGGLTQFELYHDADMFLRDMGPLGQEPISQDNVVNHICHQYQQSAVNEANYGMQLHQEANQFDDSWQPDQSMLNELHHLLNDPQGSVVPMNDAAASNHGPQNPGMICDSTNGYSVTNENQAASATADDGTTGWFSSAMWSFVDSIPFEPAFAAESPLVNKTMGRMTSFRRLRMNLADANSVPAARHDDATANAKRAGASKGCGSMLTLSVVGVVIAALWVWIG